MKKFMFAIFCLCSIAPAGVRAQSFADQLVQPPEHHSPERGSISGAYGTWKTNAAELSRGTISLPLPLVFPTERGAPLVDLVPRYSPESPLTEWGQGIQVDLEIRRFREIGLVDYGPQDQFSSPWGELVEGTDGVYYPRGLRKRVKARRVGGTWEVTDGAGKRFTFGETVNVAGGEYAWLMTSVEDIHGARTELDYIQNASGRRFLTEVRYGNPNEVDAVRVRYVYDTLANPKIDYRSGTPLLLDRSVMQVRVENRNLNTGAYELRWKTSLQYIDHPDGAGFYLETVERTFASGEVEPSSTLYWDFGIDDRRQAAFASQGDLVSRLGPLGTSAILPANATVTDVNLDGRPDFEWKGDHRMFVRTDAGWDEQPLPPESSADPRCRPQLGAFNRPRVLTRFLDGTKTPQAVSVAFQPSTGSTELLACERTGVVLGQVLLPGDWRLSSTTRLTDLDRDRRPDLIRVFPGRYEIRKNTSGSTSPQLGALLQGALSPVVAPDTAWLHDMNGDTVPDLVVRAGTSFLTVWYGIDGRSFVTHGVSLPMRDMNGFPVDPSSHLTFADINRDGLTDVWATASSSILMTNRGDRLVAVDVPALAGLATSGMTPIAVDVEGSAEVQIISVGASDVQAASLTTPSTGQLRTIYDGKGAYVGFSYARGPAVVEGEARPLVVTGAFHSVIGGDAIRYTFEYSKPVRSNNARRFLGFSAVEKTSDLGSELVEFFHDDDSTGLVLSRRVTDPGNDPAVYQIERRRYAPRTFRGLAHQRMFETAEGWGRVSDGFEVLSTTRTTKFEREFCPVAQEIASGTNRLDWLLTLAAPSMLDRDLHCLPSELRAKGSHADRRHDFDEAQVLTRNAKGQVESVVRRGPSLTTPQTMIGYDAWGRVQSLEEVSGGVTVYGYSAATGLLSTIQSPDGVVMTVSSRQPLLGRATQETTDRGSGHSWRRGFSYDGRERLETAWNNVAGTSPTTPSETHTYHDFDPFNGTLGAVESLFTFDGSRRERRINYLDARGTSVVDLLDDGTNLVFSSATTYSAAWDASTEYGPGALPPMASARDFKLGDLLTEAPHIRSEYNSGHGDLAWDLESYHSGVWSQNQVRSSLDSQGRIVTGTDRRGYSTRSYYDAQGTLRQYEDGEGQLFRYQHDSLHRLVSVELPSGEVHVVDYDELGRTASVERSGVGGLSIDYDAKGRADRVLHYDSAGSPERVTTHKHDAIGRISQACYEQISSGARDCYDFGFDGAGVASGGQRGFSTYVAGPGYSKARTYDVDGKIRSHSLTLGSWRSVETTVSYFTDRDPRNVTRHIYDGSGALVETLDLEWTRDAAGRSSGLLANGVQILTVSYNREGQVDSIGFAGGQTRSFAYDGQTRRRVGYDLLTSAGVSHAAKWQWNDRGLVAEELLRVAGVDRAIKAFDYDGRRFLTGSTDILTGKTDFYDYDSDGLITSIDDLAGSRTLVRSPGIIDVNGRTYQFDAQGRLTDRDGDRFEYGPTGQIASAEVQVGGSVKRLHFTYDEEDRRLLKNDASGAPIAAYYDDGVLFDWGWTQPIRVAGRLVGVIMNGVFYPLAVDARGSPFVSLSGQPTLLSPFGHRLSRTGLHDVVDFIATGSDGDLGFIRFGVRDYDPYLGQFVTADPLVLREAELCVTRPHECNLYAYAANNPLQYADSSGEIVETAWDIVSLGYGITSFGVNVATGNWGGAALDAAGVVADGIAVVTPGVPGGAGYAINAARAVDKAREGLYAAEKLRKLVANADKANDARKTADKLAEGAKAAEKGKKAKKKVDRARGAEKKKVKAKDRRAQERGEAKTDGTPGNNQAQNKQFRDATRGLSKDQKRKLHEQITGQNLSFKEIKELADEMLGK